MQTDTTAVLAAAAVLAALLGPVDCVPHQAKSDEMSPSLEITVVATLPAGAARGGGGGDPEETRGRALQLLAAALASRLSGAVHQGRSGCGGGANITEALEAAMAALLPPGADGVEGAGWVQGAAPPGWRRLVSHRLVPLAAETPEARAFFDDIDLSYQSILTLIVEMFASMVGLGWGAFSTFASG